MGKRKQAELARAMAELDALKAKLQDLAGQESSSSSSDDEKLIGATPSPRKKRKLENDHFNSGKPSKEFQDRSKHARPPPFNAAPQHKPPERRVRESNLLDSMSTVGKGKQKASMPEPRVKIKSRHVDRRDEQLLRDLKEERKPQAKRSRSASPMATSEDDLDITDRPKTTRNKDGTVIEELIIGPHDFKAPKGDPDFRTFEPYSATHLKSREYTHEDLQSFMDSRAALSPSLVYSLARGAQQKANSIDLACDYEVVVFGVLGWKDEVRFTRGDALKDESNRPSKPWEQKSQVKDEDKDELYRGPTKRQRQKKYIRFEVVDMSTPDASQSGSGTVHLCLFEADSEDSVEDSDGYKHTSYSGGSYGLFERMWKTPPGTLVAILGPRVSKYRPPPGQEDKGIITLTPESGSDMIVIGQARDWSTCQATKKDGNRCSSWRDVRAKLPYCTYHIQMQIKRTGARRAETYSAQTDAGKVVQYSNAKFKQAISNGHKRTVKPDPHRAVPATKYDVDKKEGLLPANVQMRGGEATYCVLPPHRSGRYATSSANALRAKAIESGNGSGGYVPGHRDGPTVAEATRKLEQELESRKRNRRDHHDLIALDGGLTVGGSYLKARMNREAGSSDGADPPKKKRGNGKKGGSEADSEHDSSDDAKKRKRPFSGAAIKKIGFDPTSVDGQGRDESPRSRKRRMGAISDLAFTEREGAKLTAPPGKDKVRSGVVAPARDDKHAIVQEDEEDFWDGLDNDDDLPQLARLAQDAESVDEDDLFIEGAPESS